MSSLSQMGFNVAGSGYSHAPNIVGAAFISKLPAMAFEKIAASFPKLASPFVQKSLQGAVLFTAAYTTAKLVSNVICSAAKIEIFSLWKKDKTNNDTWKFNPAWTMPVMEVDLSKLAALAPSFVLKTATIIAVFSQYTIASTPKQAVVDFALKYATYRMATTLSNLSFKLIEVASTQFNSLKGSFKNIEENQKKENVQQSNLDSLNAIAGSMVTSFMSNLHKIALAGSITYFVGSRMGTGSKETALFTLLASTTYYFSAPFFRQLQNDKQGVQAVVNKLLAMAVIVPFAAKRAGIAHSTKVSMIALGIILGIELFLPRKTATKAPLRQPEEQEIGEQRTEHNSFSMSDMPIFGRFFKKKP